MQKTQWTRKRLFKYSVGVCLVFLLLIEFAFRILSWAELKNYHSSLGIQGNTIQKEDSTLVFRNRPFYVDYYRRYQYNEAGMRSKPGEVLMPEKKANDFWVFLFGGSAMEGMGSNKDGEWLDITGISDYPWDENISFYLQQLLQEKMPGKKVRVFNAANTSYTIEQSYLRYLQLSALYKIDWVISMDGQNNPPELGPGESVLDFVKKDWQQNATHKFPLTWVLPLTRNSAFVNKMKQTVFHLKQQNRIKKNIAANFPRKAYWQNAISPALQFKKSDERTERAVNSFYSQLIQFDSVLNARNQKHLLLIQPHLIFRDTASMHSTERALLNYYRQEHNDPSMNTYLQQLRSRFHEKITPPVPSVELLDELDKANEQVYVDYCHFTKAGNQLIAQILFRYIMSDTTIAF